MEQGRSGEDGGSVPGAEGAPGPLGPGLLSALQVGPPAAAEAAGAQGRASGRLPLLEVEEPVGVHGPLPAHRDLGPDLVSAGAAAACPVCLPTSIHPVWDSIVHSRVCSSDSLWQQEREDMLRLSWSCPRDGGGDNGIL